MEANYGLDIEQNEIYGVHKVSIILPTALYKVNVDDLNMFNSFEEVIIFLIQFKDSDVSNQEEDELWFDRVNVVTSGGTVLLNLFEFIKDNPEYLV